MKKKLILAKISTVFAVFMLCLSIFAFVSLQNRGVAWFSANKKTDASGMTVKLDDSMNIVKTVEYYKIDAIVLQENSEGEIYNEYVFKEKVASPTLSVLSAIEPNRQILIKIELKEGVDRVTLKGQSHISTYPTSFSKEDNSASSIIQFQVITDIQMNENNTYVLSSLELQPSTHFTTVETENGSVQIEFQKEIEIYQTPMGETDDYIYIVVDYYEPSTEYILMRANNGEIEGLEIGVDNIGFICDFIMTIIET